MLCRSFTVHLFRLNVFCSAWAADIAPPNKTSAKAKIATEQQP